MSVDSTVKASTDFGHFPGRYFGVSRSFKRQHLVATSRWHQPRYLDFSSATMSLALALCTSIFLLPGMACAFHGGWASWRDCGRLQHRTAGTLKERYIFNNLPAQSTARCTAVRKSQPARSCRKSQPTALQQLRASPNEYDIFFNNACYSGKAVIRGLDAEERARRAAEAEKVEDDIIEIATVLREKANEMVDKTGSLNFGIIQPMIDEIQVLKAKYKVIVGASTEEDAESPVKRNDSENPCS